MREEHLRQRWVIDALNEFMEQTQRTTAAGKSADPYQVMYRMSELMAAMRTDLGLSNKSMGRHNRRLLRVLIFFVASVPAVPCCALLS